MVYARGSLHFVQSADFGGYGTIYIDIQLVAEVNDAKNAMTVTVTSNNSTYNAGVTKGWGFINVLGLMWNGTGFDGTGPSLPYGQVENYGQVVQQMSSISGGQIPNSVIYGIALSDDAPMTVRQEIRGAQSHTIALNANDFNADGTLKSIPIARLFTRYYTQNRTARVRSGVDASISTERLSWPYFPWAVNKSGWKSLDSNGGLRKRSGSGWSDLKNQIDEGQVQHVFHRLGSGWKRAAKL